MPQATAMAVANITAQLQAKEVEMNPTTPVVREKQQNCAHC